MSKDFLYTNGVIASREKYFLKDKIFRLAETGAEEAFRALSESGFGAGAEISSVYDFEKLISAEENSLDEFIREYAPSACEINYFFAPRDFHNAKAALKAVNFNLDAEKMFAPEGLIPASLILKCVQEEDYAPLGENLSLALNEAQALMRDSDGNEKFASGAEVGAIFERALYSRLLKKCGKNPVLKKLIKNKTDMSNILSALRAESYESFEKYFIEGGKVSLKKFAGVFSENAESAFDKTQFEKFYKICFSAKEKGLPLSEGEKALSTQEADFFAEKKYELERGKPFLYFVFRRRIEIENVRILFVCLMAGMSEADIKKRLRAV